MSEFLSANYWDERYQQQQTGWDLGEVSPPLKAYFDQLTRKDLRILIPGAGNAYEAFYLADLGFEQITVVDFAASVTDSLKRKCSTSRYTQIQIITANLFSLEGTYDLIIEQTFFCALDPSLRGAYVKKMYELLDPKGSLTGLLFNRSFDQSPPFGGSIHEYEQLFSPFFLLHTMAPCYNSIIPRAGTELFIQLTPRTIPG